MIADTYFNIDYKTKKIIKIFESGSYKNWKKEDLEWEISQLNEYQFLYTLDSILFTYKYLSSKIILDHFLENDFIYCFFTPSYSDEIKEIKVIDGVLFNCKMFDEIKLNESFSPEDNIIELIYFIKKIEQDLTPLAKELEETFKILEEKSKNNIYINLTTNIVDYEPYYDSDDSILGNKNDYYTYFSNIFSVIRNDLIIEYDRPNNNENYLTFHKAYGRIEANCLKFELLNPTTKNLNYKSVLIYPLCYSLEEWKKLVYDKIKEQKTERNFNKHIEFFKECLSQYKVLSGKSYIRHRYYFVKEAKKEANNHNEFSDIMKMTEWVTAFSYKKIELNTSITFIDKVPESEKIQLSYRTNQTNLLKTFEKYFECSKINYDKEILRSTIYHFTIVDKSKRKEKGYSSKFIDYTSLKKIDFIPKKNTSDIIKIFFRMIDLGYIQEKPHTIFRKMGHLFSNNKAKGLGYDNIKKKWYAYKKGKITLKIDIDSFWFYFVSILP